MKRTVTLIILLAVVIILLGIAVALQGRTIVEWWKPAAICAVPAAVVGVAGANVARRITRWNRRWLNAAAAAVVSFSLLIGAFYALNYWLSDSDAGAGTVSAVVAQKYTQERYDTKRVGRRTVRGQKRTVYNVVIKLPDGSAKKLSVPAGRYARTRLGQRFALQVERGLFGLPVIKHIGFPDEKPQIRKRKSKFNKQNSNTI